MKPLRSIFFMEYFSFLYMLAARESVAEALEATAISLPSRTSGSDSPQAYTFFLQDIFAEASA